MPGKATGYLRASTQWLFVSLFLFPILPLAIANLLFIAFSFFVILSWIYIKPDRVWLSIKRNLVIALAFLPYLIDLAIHPHNSIVSFEAEKKLLFFVCPPVIGIYMAMYSLKPLKVYMYCFIAAVLALTLYTLALLVFRNILFSPQSFENGAYILRNSFEKISHLHPTYYSLFATVSILWLIYEYHKQTPLLKMLFVIIGLILFFQELFVAAKMPLAALVLSSLFLLYRITSNRKKLITIYLILIPCLVMLPILVPSLKNRIYEVKDSITLSSDQPNTVNDRQVIFDCSKTIFMNNIWFGLGSGNYQSALNVCYLCQGLNNIKNTQYNAHNQFLTMGINYGIIPLALFIIAMCIYIKRTIANPFATVLMISTIMVMLTESILERQWGVYFYVLFFMLIINISAKVQGKSIAS